MDKKPRRLEDSLEENDFGMIVADGKVVRVCCTRFCPKHETAKDRKALVALSGEEGRYGLFN